MVPAQKILDTAREREGRHHRPLGPDHALARRDGACRGRDGARGLRHPAADRRRDHQPGPHRGEDPSALRSAARPSMSPTPAARSASSPACSRRRRSGRYVETVRAEYRKVADAHARAEADKQRAAARRRRAPTAFKIDWAAYEPPKPTFPGTRVFRTYDLAELVPLHRLDAVLPDLGAARAAIPAILDDDEQGAAARQLFDDAQDDAGARSSRSAGSTRRR